MNLSSQVPQTNVELSSILLQQPSDSVLLRMFEEQQKHRTRCVCDMKELVQRDGRVSSLFVQKWCFSSLERDFSKYFSANIFLFGANFQNLFRIHRFPHFSYTEKMKTTSPLPAIY